MHTKKTAPEAGALSGWGAVSLITAMDGGGLTITYYISRLTRQTEAIAAALAISTYHCGKCVYYRNCTLRIGNRACR